MSVYTKTGDKGTTSLIGGERVPKYDSRVEAYGTVDELSAHLALLSDLIRERWNGAPCLDELTEILQRLMSVQALLAVGKGGEGKLSDVPSGAIEYLEQSIDRMSENLPPVTHFTIPGGDKTVSQCHICRTVCRRAERAALRAAAEHPTAPGALIYLNRLSDWIYTLGRQLVDEFGVKETLWIP